MSEGRAASHTLLHTSVSKVTVPLATGLRNQHVVAAEPEETLLKVVGAANAAAVKLHRGTQQVRRSGSELLLSHRESERHRAHDGVPRGGKDFGAVVTVVATLQLAREIVSGQLHQNTAQVRSAGGSVLVV